MRKIVTYMVAARSITQYVYFRLFTDRTREYKACKAAGIPVTWVIEEFTSK